MEKGRRHNRHAGGHGVNRIGKTAMKSIALWALGVPLVVIVLLNVFHVL